MHVLTYLQKHVLSACVSWAQAKRIFSSEGCMVQSFGCLIFGDVVIILVQGSNSLL